MTTKKTTRKEAERVAALKALEGEEAKTYDDILTPHYVVRDVPGESGLPEEGLGARVRGIRERKNLTHDGLSELTKLADPEGRGISRTTIRGYELGTYKPGAREIRILCAALEVTPTWLLLGANESERIDVGREPRSLPSKRDAETKRFRFAKPAYLLLAYTQLGPDERRQISDLIETLHRLTAGEVRARAMKAFIEDFVDVVQDFGRDSEEGAMPPAGEIVGLFKSMVQDFRGRHGDAEADLLLTTLGPLADFFSKQQGSGAP